MTTSPVNEYLAVPNDLSELNEDGPRWAALSFPGLSKKYQISDRGAVISPLGRPLVKGHQGLYASVSIKRDHGKTSTVVRVDRLVLSTFGNGNFPDMVPDHIDNDPSNDRFDNLAWREPNVREKAAMIGGRSAAATVKTRKRQATGVVKRAIKEKKPVLKDEIKVLRVYQLGGVQVTATPNGGITQLPPTPLSPQEAKWLIEIMANLGEMNKAMGV